MSDELCSSCSGTLPRDAHRIAGNFFKLGINPFTLQLLISDFYIWVFDNSICMAPVTCTSCRQVWRYYLIDGMSCVGDWLSSLTASGWSSFTFTLLLLQACNKCTTLTYLMSTMLATLWMIQCCVGFLLPCGARRFCVKGLCCWRLFLVALFYDVS